MLNVADIIKKEMLQMVQVCSFFSRLSHLKLRTCLSCIACVSDSFHNWMQEFKQKSIKKSFRIKYNPTSKYKYD